MKTVLSNFVKIPPSCSALAAYETTFGQSAILARLKNCRVFFVSLFRATVMLLIKSQTRHLSFFSRAQGKGVEERG